MRPIEVKPAQGGALMTAVSADAAGAANYVVKRDFRRYLDREIKTEGRVPYQELPDSEEPVTLIVSFQRPNGDRALVVGTPTRLFRYFGAGSTYFVDGYIEDDYFEDYSNSFALIGNGFNGRRWEAVTTDGTLILNNRVDLPVSYRVEQLQVEWLEELREQGVARVGSIAVSNGVLLLFDITYITPEDLALLLSLESSGTITASVPGPTASGSITVQVDGNTAMSSADFFTMGMEGLVIRFANGVRRTIDTVLTARMVTVSGTALDLGSMMFWVLNGPADSTVTASAAFFTPDMVGAAIVWDSGAERTIQSYISPTQVTVQDDTAVPAGLFGVTDAPFIRWEGATTRIPYRILWSANDGPTRFSGTIPGTILAGSRNLLLDYPTSTFQVGQSIIVLGAGLLGGNLLTTVDAVQGRTLLLHEAASTAMVSTPVRRSDSIGSLVGFFDLQDDGSAILRGLNLRGQLVVYKETSIFVGQYTGIPAAPWQFEKAYGDEEGATSETQNKCLYYRNTLIGVGGAYHIFSGRSTFYRFDLTSRIPVELPAFELCKDLFYRHADIKDDDYIFCSTNGLTKEVFICLPPQVKKNADPTIMPDGVGSDNPGDRLIRLDFISGTISTSPELFTAGATVIVGSERLYLMGLALTGQIERYGLLEKAPEMYYRDAGGTPFVIVTDTLTTGTIICDFPLFREDHVNATLMLNDPDRQCFFITGFVDEYTVEVQGPGIDGLTCDGMTILYGAWTRGAQSYQSDLRSGLEAWGRPSFEKIIGDYMLNAASGVPNEWTGVASPSSSSQNVWAQCSFYGARSASQTPVLLGQRTLTAAAGGLIPMHFSQVYTQDRVRVSGYGPYGIASRIFNVSSESKFGRFTPIVVGEG